MTSLHDRHFSIAGGASQGLQAYLAFVSTSQELKEGRSVLGIVPVMCELVWLNFPPDNCVVCEMAQGYKERDTTYFGQ
jgi:hypothetical protein